MKKITLYLIALSVCISSIAFAQKGAYVTIHAGYAMQMSSQNVGGFYNLTRTITTVNYEQLNVSLGKGLNMGGTFGYMFSDHIGAELRLSYLLGAESNATEYYSVGHVDKTLSANMFRINPSLVISSGGEKLNPYAKFGFLIGMGTINYEYYENEGGDITIQKMKMDGDLAFGLSAAVGTNFLLSENIALFGEIEMINMSYAPAKGVLTEASYNGTDLLPSMTTSEKEMEFVDQYMDNFLSPAPDSQPSTELKQKMPFGSVGINIGIRIGF